MLKELADAFAGHTELPIELTEIRNAVLELGYQDEVIFSGVSEDPGELKGAFYQYTVRDTPYGDPILTTLIIYNTSLTLDWQRIVCCKELVHIFDRKIEQTETPEEVGELIDKLLGPLSTEDVGTADLMAAKDKIALYLSLPLLFPASAREEAKSKLQSGEATVEDIAAWAVLPKQIVIAMLDDDFYGLLDYLLDC